MTRRAEMPHGEDATTQFAPVAQDDAFLDALARGQDPSSGKDPLARLLLDLKADIERPMPGAPLVAFPQHETASAAPTQEPSRVVSLDVERSRRRGVNPWVSGLIGAAAATVVVAGSGAVLYNATPSSPLWGVASSVFGDRTAAVELASTLEQLEVASQEGDADYFAALLHQARELVDSMKPVASSSGDGAPATAVENVVTRTVTVTVTATPSPNAPAPGPQEPTQPAQNPEPAAPVAPGQNPQPAQPPQPAQQSRPAQQPSSVRVEPSAQPAQPAQPIEPGQSARPSQLSQSSPVVQPQPQPQPENPGVQPSVVEPGSSEGGAQGGAVPQVVPRDNG